jgi:hypothetical protein
VYITPISPEQLQKYLQLLSLHTQRLLESKVSRKTFLKNLPLKLRERKED